MYQILKGSRDSCIDSKSSVLRKETTILDPLLREIKAEYLVDYESSTAYIEVANSSGLQLLAKEERNPFIASSIVSELYDLLLKDWVMNENSCDHRVF
jgi:glycerate kinase